MKRSPMHAFRWVIGAGTASTLPALLPADDLPTAFKYPFLLAWVALVEAAR
ncbi:hypothetical protein ACIPC1_10265 [Streptomyces sp. NPDC087263]|uniref:hypothetical protein n=1 Tax=Streptomyces sp. NPDC087263 TaxID=3365773 RepID=UPI003824FA4D